MIILTNEMKADGWQVWGIWGDASLSTGTNWLTIKEHKCKCVDNSPQRLSGRESVIITYELLYDVFNSIGTFDTLQEAVDRAKIEITKT